MNMKINEFLELYDAYYKNDELNIWVCDEYSEKSERCKHICHVISEYGHLPLLSWYLDLENKRLIIKTRTQY